MVAIFWGSRFCVSATVLLISKAPHQMDLRLDQDPVEVFILFLKQRRYSVQYTTPCPQVSDTSTWGSSCSSSGRVSTTSLWTWCSSVFKTPYYVLRSLTISCWRSPCTSRVTVQTVTSTWGSSCFSSGRSPTTSLWTWYPSETLRYHS